MANLNNEERFLITSYIKTSVSPHRSFNPKFIGRMLNLTNQQLEMIIADLNSKKLIDPSSGYGDEIKLTRDGYYYSQSLTRDKNFKILSFNDQVQHIPFMEKAIAGYKFYYNLESEYSVQQNNTITVLVSDFVITKWQLNFSTDRARKILFKLGLKKLLEKIKDGSAIPHDSLILMSADVPNTPPLNEFELSENYDYNYEYLVEPDEKSLSQEIKTNQLATQIIETRDVINNAFRVLHKEKLLSIPDEKNLLCLFKEAKNAPEFSYYVSSLAGLIGEMNKKLLIKISNYNSKEDASTITLLDLYLKRISKSDPEIIKVFRNILSIRKGFPVHNVIREVVESLNDFGIQYPVTDYKEAWSIILNKYNHALQKLQDIFIPLINNPPK